MASPSRAKFKPWVLPIWTSVNHARVAGLISQITPELSEMGVHISTRLTMLPHVIGRLNKDVSDLYDAAKNYKPEHLFTKTCRGVALQVDDKIKHLVIADVDSFLFEINACAELMQKFFQLLHCHAGDNIEDGDVTNAVQAILKNKGVSEIWFKKLDQARNFAAHDGTPYIAIDISNQDNWKALFMKENTLNFEDSRKFFSIADLQEIADGFLQAKAVLQEHLVKLFQSHIKH